MSVSYSRASTSARLDAWTTQPLTVLQVSVIAAVADPVAWHITLYATAPAKGTWRILGGLGVAVPVVVIPATTGSNAVIVSGAAPIVQWIPSSASVAGDYVAAAIAPFCGLNFV